MNIQIPDSYFIRLQRLGYSKADVVKLFCHMIDNVPLPDKTNKDDQ